MARDKKRSHREGSSSSSTKIDSNKKHHSSSTSNPPPISPRQRTGNHHPTFVSYLETPNLTPKVKLLCEIIASTHSLSVEKVLGDTGIRVSQEDVEDVLKLSYGFPGPAVKFFRWSGFQLGDKHSPYAWNLVVDLLGKNCLFDAMWDAIKSMKKEGLLSLATFASVFSSYVTADRVQEAIMTFEVMGQYGCARDTVALNSLMSAICRDGKTVKAKEFLYVVRDMIRPDADTYAILLEGWEGEGDVISSRQTFTQMVGDIGWDTKNVPAYDSFLTTLLKAPNGMLEVLRFLDAMREMGCYPGLKFFKSALEECVRTADGRSVRLLWEAMMRIDGLRPDTQMYNSVIALHSYLNESDVAKGLMDDMVFNGVFPDSQTYNVLLKFLIKRKKYREASPVFTEMVKNEFVPDHANCSSAVKMYLDHGDTYMAIKVWKCMIESHESDLDETGNLLVLGLRDVNRLPEAVKYAEDMIDRGIKLNSSTLSKLKHSLAKVGKNFIYDELLRKWKTR
ncbi:pentatricopeptide repeat-containing protein At1g77360, mitochondrial-like [Actinidia eriantha]|uniref:pentatricopeptide repeat-containing protein At1g77360, mitochondrial-like n=1 Tax=Actinidia eriantha TaxID=165200 RepID=UPI00258F2325|nr:pentatricopeptide repeat-containing protein At1g77360, mitochondrial-like [Actinidia eriantha]XP_057501552.1 pentatricopeptide repeat-containing protein At1g77360, mitochondrial-like [Actinidia eriantha]